jgi:Domain of unknown function (DUF4143)
MAAARIDETAILSDPDLLGRILDTFVVAQLRPEIEMLQPRARLHHLRTEAGRQEVDITVDLDAGRLIAAEVKATSAGDEHSSHPRHPHPGTRPTGDHAVERQPTAQPSRLVDTRWATIAAAATIRERLRPPGPPGAAHRSHGV